MTEEKTARAAGQNRYEIMIIFHPDTGEEKVEKKLKEFHDLVREAGGEIWRKDIWGLREMAYKIQRQTRGHYVVLNFDLSTSKLKKVDKHMKLEKDIMRHMVTRVPDTYEPKSLDEYLEEEKKDSEKKRKEKAGKTGKKIEKKTGGKSAKEKEKIGEKSAKEKAEKAPEEKPEKTPRDHGKNKEKELDELDKKLQSIINDSDIIL